jgi:hypothetical protein
MTAVSMAERIGEWVADELRAQSVISREEFGWAVTMMPVPQPAGGTAVFWMILVTLRHPLLGHDAFGANTRLQASEPGEAAVRAAARDSAATLRTAHANASKDILSQGNGHAPLPAGLQGRRP